MRNRTEEVINALNNSPMQWKTTVPKREAGTWISHGLTLADEYEEFSVLECPVCHGTVYEGEKTYRFCPFCGTRLEKKHE